MTASRLPPKRSEPLAAHEAFTRICDLRDGRNERRKTALAAFELEERGAEEQIAARVPGEQLGRLTIMLSAMPEADAMAKELVAQQAIPELTVLPTAQPRTSTIVDVAAALARDKAK